MLMNSLKIRILWWQVCVPYLISRDGSGLTFSCDRKDEKLGIENNVFHGGKKKIKNQRAELNRKQMRKEGMAEHMKDNGNERRAR